VYLSLICICAIPLHVCVWQSARRLTGDQTVAHTSLAVESASKGYIRGVSLSHMHLCSTSTRVCMAECPPPNWGSDGGPYLTGGGIGRRGAHLIYAYIQCSAVYKCVHIYRVCMASYVYGRVPAAAQGIRCWPIPHWRWNRPARGTFDSVTPRAVPSANRVLNRGTPRYPHAPRAAAGTPCFVRV